MEHSTLSKPHHILVFYGDYIINHHKLHPRQHKHQDSFEPESWRPVVLPVERSGIAVGYMRLGHTFLIVKVDDLVLPNPFAFVDNRHGVDGPDIACWEEISASAVVQVLVDTIAHNPGMRDYVAHRLFNLVIGATR